MVEGTSSGRRGNLKQTEKKNAYICVELFSSRWPKNRGPTAAGACSRNINNGRRKFSANTAPRALLRKKSGKKNRNEHRERT